MPDILDKVFDETEATVTPTPELTAGQLTQQAEAEPAAKTDILDRIFDEPEEPAFELPDEPVEQEQQLKDLLSVADRMEIGLADAERHYKRLRELDEKHKAFAKRTRNFEFGPMGYIPDFPERVEYDYTTHTLEKIPVHLGRTIYELPKGVARFLERGVGGTFGGTAFDWLGQFIEQGGAALDAITKWGSKDKDRIYNPYAQAIMAAGRGISAEGKKGREYWAAQAATGWEAFDQDLYKRDPISYGAGRLSEGVASSALSVLAVYLSGGAAAPAMTLNKTVQINRGLAVLSAMSAAGGFEHAQNQGENLLWSTVHGLADGTIEYAMESKFLEGVEPGKSATWAGLKEAGEEFVTGMLQNTRAGILENNKKGMSAYAGAKKAIADSLAQAPWEVAAGFIGGWGTVTGANLVDLVERTNAQPVAEAAEKPAEQRAAEAEAERAEKSGYEMTPDEIRAIADPEDRRTRAIEYLDDTSEQWRRLEDRLMELEETDPFAKNPETQQVQNQLDTMIEDFLKPAEQLTPKVEVPAKPETPAEIAQEVKTHAIEILPRKEQILSEIDEAIKKAPSEADTRKRLEAEIPEPDKSLPENEYRAAVNERYKRIADEIERIKSQTVKFEIDGGANIINTQEALKTFRGNVEGLKETEQWPKKPTRKIGKKAPIAARQEKIGELVKAPDGWFTDGRVLIKGEPPAKTKRAADYKQSPPVDIDPIIWAATEPAELQHYAIEAPEAGKGISGEPVPHIEQAGERGPVAVFKSGEQFFMYAQDLFNVIRNRFPEATYGIKAETGLLVAYMGQGNPVAAMMPIVRETGEAPGMAEPPVSMEEVPETEPLVKPPAEPVVGTAVRIVEKPSTAHLADAAGQTGRIADIQVVRGKARSWAVQLDNGQEYIVDDLKDMEIQSAREKAEPKAPETGFMPEHERSEPGVLIIQSDIGQIHIPEAVLTGQYGKDLETIFAYGNFQSEVPQPDLKRSLSVGDTVQYRGHTLMVMQQGWRDITGLLEDAIKALQTSENAIGLDATWRQAEERLREQERPEEALESQAPGQPNPEYESLRRLRDELQEKQDAAVQEAVDYLYQRWPTVAERYERAELIGQGAGFIESFLRDLRQQIDEQIKTVQAGTEIAKNAVRISSELDHYITPLSEMIQQIAGLNSRMEVLRFGTEAPRAEEASQMPEENDIKNVVVDNFRNWPQQVKKPGKDFWVAVMAAAKKLVTPYRYKALRSMLGVFRHEKRPIPRVVGIEVQDVTDALTATHELGHNIDWLINGKTFPRSLKARFPDTTVGEMPLRKEAQNVSKILRPDLWERPKAYVKGHVELMADFVSLYILDPEMTRQIAPNLTSAFEAKLAGNPELFETISRLQESRYTGPDEPPVAEHIRKEFPLPKEFTPLQLTIDMTDNDYVKAAENLGITAVRHYKMLLHRAETEAQRIDKLVPKADRQTDLVVIAENGEKNPWTGRTKEEILAEGITPNEQKAIDLFRAYQEQARQTVNKYLRGADIAEYIRFISDYFIHAYHTPMTEKYKVAIARWAKRSPQAKKRILPDLNTAVELGLKPRTKTLSDGLRLWAGINYRVATNKAFLRILPNITNEDGVSILQKPQDFPEWPTVDYAPIRQTYSVPLGDRGILLFQGRVAVDPRVKPFVDSMFGVRVFSTPVRIIEGLNALWKSFELTVFSLFHHAEEFFSAVGSLGPRAMPFVGGYYGKKAQVFGKQKLFGFLPEHIGALQAGKQLEQVPEFLDDYIANGGQTGYISSEGINLIERMLKGVEDYLKVTIQTKPGIGQAAWVPYVPAKTLRAAYSWWQHLLWDNVERAKLVTYYQIVSDGALNSNLPIKDVKQIANKYNADNFGGREWLTDVFRNPKTRQLFTQVLMSLDWTWSQIRSAAWPFMYGGKTETEQARRELMRKIGRHHWFWYTAAMAGFTIAGSFALTGHGPWDNEKGHKLNIDWTKIWRLLPWNRDWKEKGDYQHRYMSMGKAGRELIRWVLSPLKAFGYKLSPVARTIFEQATGYNMGSSFPEPWAREDLEGYQELYARFKGLMENFKPFSLSGNNAFLAFPSAKGMTEFKATRAFEDIYQSKAKIATGGIAGKIAELDAAIKKDEKKLRAEIIEACKLNNVDAEKTDRMALSQVRSKYYRLFWDAAKEQDVEQSNRYADALLELGISGRGFVQSLRYRAGELPKEAKKGGIKALQQTLREKQQGQKGD